jgi:anti-sigma regulatory factor (Ser/Thr protein kinase)
MPAELVSQMQIGCDFGAIRKAAEWLRAGCKDIDPAQLAELELAVVEAVTNVVKHGGIASTEKLSFELSREGDAIKIVITDPGRPISPAALDLSASALDFDPEDVANLPTNGLGLAIIREVTDDFDYQTQNGINTMRLTKRI